jgi:hypothetical protein
MPITFGSLEELKEFVVEFQVKDTRREGLTQSKTASRVVPDQVIATVSKPSQVKSSASSVKSSNVRKQAKAPASTTDQPVVTLTSKIQEVIRGFIDRKEEFTANDIYFKLYKIEPSVNKQSVITSVLKQMNTTFSDIKAGEKPGNGPRPVKVYYPAGSKKSKK